MKSIASVLFTLLLFVNPAHANNKGYCQKAQTTADLIECIGAHQADADAYMNALFVNLQKLDKDFYTLIHTQQKDWLNHRDEICTTEGKVYEGGSLQSVQQAQCRVRLTDNRNEHLKILLQGMDVSNIPEYSNPPRWVNVLVNDYPEMFWGFGSAQLLDTDCDGVNENIVRGVDANHKMTLAIADSEQTGRPIITVLNFDDRKSCDILPNIVIDKLPEPKPENNAPLACVQKLKIQTKSCGDYTIQYNTTQKIYQILEQE